MLYNLFLVLVIIFLLICVYNPIVLENWEIYKQKPLNYIQTGSSPINFYERKRYKKPYRYPFQFIKSYPVDHLSYLD